MIEYGEYREGTKVFAEVFRPGGASDAGALRVAKKGKTLYDSGVVAAGAAIASGVLDVAGIEMLMVLADNVAGSTLRDLALTSYLDDGSTQIESLLLRRVAFGAAPAGSSYAPGAVRALIGPSPPSGPVGVYTLADVTTAANATANVTVVTEDADAVWAVAKPSAAVDVVLYGAEVYDDGTTDIGYLVTGHAASDKMQSFFWAPGAPQGFQPTINDAAHVSALGIPVPRRLKFSTNGTSSGITTRLQVFARGRPPGTFAVPMVLPPKAQLTLAAGGGANGRLTIIGR